MSRELILHHLKETVSAHIAESEGDTVRAALLKARGNLRIIAMDEKDLLLLADELCSGDDKDRPRKIAETGRSLSEKKLHLQYTAYEWLPLLSKELKGG